MKFIITSLTSWDEIPRARHQVTEELIRAGHEVVFVEKNRVGLFRIDVRAEKPGLTVITPFFPIDYRFRYRLPGISELYQFWLSILLKREVGDHVVINFDYTAHLLTRIFANTVYYCNDDYIGNSKYPVWIIDRYHASVERRVAQNARFCVATAGPLVNKLALVCSSVYRISLGGPRLDQIMYQRNFDKGEKIKVGLMGAIKLGHVSPQLCNRVIKQKDMVLSVIGNVEPEFAKELDAPERISMKGVLTGDSLYREMASFDVAIAPYDVNGINAGGTPNKLFQYLACACPVVITNIRNINRSQYPSGTVYVADDDDEFIMLIRRAYAEDCPEYARCRQHIANENSWEKRVQFFLSLLRDHGLTELDAEQK